MTRFRTLSKDSEIPASSGYYIIRCKESISHIGTSSNLRKRVRELISLGHHRGSDEVLCVAYCTKTVPEISFVKTNTPKEARVYESKFKRTYGEPPYPREGNEMCVKGRKLRDDLIRTAGPNNKDAGYIEAVFDIGEDFHRIVCNPRFDYLWQRLGGKPPGPWCSS
jgi:hypothetical protein